MGGFLLMSSDIFQTEVGKFPPPLEVWVGSYTQFDDPVPTDRDMFPAPFEVWVGSYIIMMYVESSKQKFPAPREVWVGSYIWV